MIEIEMLDNIKKFLVLYRIKNMTLGLKSAEWTKNLEDRIKFYYDKLKKTDGICIQFQNGYIENNPIVYVKKKVTSAKSLRLIHLNWTQKKFATT